MESPTARLPSSRFAHTKPVPRGPNNHLCVPGGKRVASQRRDLSISTRTMRTVDDRSGAQSTSSRLRFTSFNVSAIRAMGSRTPLLECTQVTPTARVFDPIALRMRSAISSRRNRFVRIEERRIFARSLRSALWRAGLIRDGHSDHV